MANQPTNIPAEPSGPDFQEMGASGLRRMGEDVFEEWLPELAGQKAIKAYREMSDNDTIVGAFLFAIRMLMRQVAWEFEPADETEEAQEWADFCNDAIEDMEHDFADFIAEVFSMLVYGWSWFEVVYKIRKGPDETDLSKRSKFTDSKIGWRKFSIRSQDSLNGWVYDEENGDLLGMRQLAPPKYEDKIIPKWKSLHFVTESAKENPEGRSILRNAWIAYYRKKRIEAIEAIGIERDLAGLPMARVNAKAFLPTASAEEKAMLEAAKKLVANVRRDLQEGIVLPSEYDTNGNQLFEFELLSTAGTRQLDISSTITRYDQRIAMTVLADFILLGTQNVGSWALSKDKTNLFGLAISAWSKLVAEAFNRQAVEKLMRLNEVKAELWPKLRPGDPQGPDMEAFANMLKTLSEAGMPLFPDKAMEGHIRRLFKLPEPSPEAEEMFEEEAKLKLEQAQLGIEGQAAAIEQYQAGAQDGQEGAGGDEEGADGQSPQDAPQKPQKAAQAEGGDEEEE